MELTISESKSSQLSSEDFDLVRVLIPISKTIEKNIIEST